MTTRTIDERGIPSDGSGLTTAEYTAYALAHLVNLGEQPTGWGLSYLLGSGDLSPGIVIIGATSQNDAINKLTLAVNAGELLPANGCWYRPICPPDDAP